MPKIKKRSSVRDQNTSINKMQYQNLSSAIESGNIEEVKRLSHTFENNASTSKSQTLLYIAISSRQLEIAKILLARGCQVSSRTGSKDNKILHVAVNKGDSDIVEFLLKKLISAKDEDENGMIPLYMLAYRFDYDDECSRILESILNYGPHINTKHRVSGYTLLHFAAEAGNIKLIPLIISKKIKLNVRSTEGLTPLHVAASKGHGEIVSLLLKRGAKHDIRDRRNRSALSLAVENGDMSTVEVLLNRTCSSRNSRKSEPSPLRDDTLLIYYAVKSGNKAIVELLLLKGAVVNAHSLETKKTALHIAVQMDNEQIVNLLLKNSANPSAADERGLNPLHIASESGSLPIVIALLKNLCFRLNNRSTRSSPFTPAGTNGFTPMHMAVDNNNKDIVKIFLESGISANISANNGLTPLHIAVQRGNKKIILLLLQFGADVNSSGQSDIETPLFAAVEKGNLEIFEILSQAAFRLPATYAKGYFLLYISVYRHQEEIVNSLLKKGVDPNSIPGKYLTPLHAAAQKGHEKILKLLLQHGAKVNPKPASTPYSEYLSTPLLAAVHGNYERIAELLLNHGANCYARLGSGSEKSTSSIERFFSHGDYKDSEVGLEGSKVTYTSLHLAAEAGNLKIVKKLLNRGANTNILTISRETPLGIAVQKDHATIVQCLLSSGANMYHNGQEVLRIASMKGNLVIIEMLLKHGANANPSGSFDRSPLAIAVENELEAFVQTFLEAHADPNFKQNGTPVLHIAVGKKNPTIIKMLLKYGADIDALSADGETPLGLAVEQEDENIVRDLLEAGANTEIYHIDKKVLYFAIQKRNAKIVDLLLTFNSDVNSINSEQSLYPCTLLKSAVLESNAEIVELLLKKGASMNAVTENEPPFHIALSGRCKRMDNMIETFIKYGASIHSKCRNGKTPLFHTVERDNVQNVKLLLKMGASFKRETDQGAKLIQSAMSNADEEIIKLLIDYGIDLNTPSNNGLSPLQGAFYRNRYFLFPTNYTRRIPSLLKLFLINGADINVCNRKTGNSVLHEAVEKEMFMAVEILLLYGANINLINKQRDTCLNYAVQKAQHYDLNYSDSDEDVDDDQLIHGELNSTLDDNPLYYNPSTDSGLSYYYPRNLPRRLIVRLITQEIVRLKAAKEYICKENLNELKTPFIQGYFKRCENEIERMKKKTIENGVTYFDVLVAKDSKLAIYARNRNLILDLQSYFCAQEFPVYKKVLLNRIEKGIEQKTLLESSVKSLKTVLRFEFPALIVEEIFSYLTPRDLRNVSTACNHEMFIY